MILYNVQWVSNKIVKMRRLWEEKHNICKVKGIWEKKNMKEKDIVWE